MRIGTAVKVMVRAMALSVAVVPAALAQQPAAAPAARVAVAPPSTLPAARLALVEGDVLASTETGLAAAEQGAPLKAGTRVMTMSRSRATLQYADGCVVELKPNVRVQVRPELPCKERLVVAQLTVPDPLVQFPIQGASQLPPGGLSSLALAGDLVPLAGVAIGIAGVTAIVANRFDSSVSPN
jgi:hypothetical protein